MLRDRLIALQRSAGQTDEEFAERLRIPRSTWQNTRTEVRNVARRVALAALDLSRRERLPDLEREAVSFLLSNAASVAANDARATEPEGAVA